MGTYRLKSLFGPRAIAVVGASPRGFPSAGSCRAICAAGDSRVRYTWSIPVTRTSTAKPLSKTSRCSTRPRIRSSSPPQRRRSRLWSTQRRGAWGRRGYRITAGLGHGPGSLAEQARQVARTYGLRLLGPNCLGLLVPSARLNASLVVHQPKIGDLALISQSGGLAAGLVGGRGPVDRLFRHCLDRRRPRHRFRRSVRLFPPSTARHGRS